MEYVLFTCKDIMLTLTPSTNSSNLSCDVTVYSCLRDEIVIDNNGLQKTTMERFC